MKNKSIMHARQSIEIYKSYYKPSLNFSRFFKSIMGVLIFGSGTVAPSYAPLKKKLYK